MANPCSPPLTAALPAPPRGLYHFSLWVVVAVLVLIKVGALVTSTNSGLAYVSWPLADGQVWPADINTQGKWEMGHRYVGMVIGLLTIALALAVRTFDPRPWLARVSYGLLALVCVQGAIGALGVFQNLPVWNSASHGVLAQVILCGFAFVTFALSPAWRERHRGRTAEVKTARKLAVFALGLVFGQVLVGALARHAKTVEGGWSLVWLHVSLALFVSFAILVAASYASGRFRHVPGLSKLTRAGLGVLLAQIALGFATLAVRGGGKWTAAPEDLGRALVISGHVVCGSLLALGSTLLVARVWRNLVPENGSS